MHACAAPPRCQYPLASCHPESVFIHEMSFKLMRFCYLWAELARRIRNVKFKLPIDLCIPSLSFYLSQARSLYLSLFWPVFCLLLLLANTNNWTNFPAGLAVRFESNWYLNCKQINCWPQTGHHQTHTERTSTRTRTRSRPSGGQRRSKGGAGKQSGIHIRKLHCISFSVWA